MSLDLPARIATEQVIIQDKFTGSDKQPTYEAQGIRSYNDFVRAVDSKIYNQIEIKFVNDRNQPQQALNEMNSGVNSISQSTFYRFYNNHPYISTKIPAYKNSYLNYKNVVIADLQHFFNNAISQASTNQLAGNFIINTMTNPQTNEVLFYVAVKVRFNQDKVIIEMRTLSPSASQDIQDYLNYINSNSNTLGELPVTGQFHASQNDIDYSNSKFPTVSKIVSQNLAKNPI
jgi:hypothetical protein